LPLSAITEDVVWNVVNNWMSQVKAEGQAKKAVRYMSAMFNLAKRRKWVEENPFDSLKGIVPRSSKANLEYIEIAECNKIMEIIELLQDANPNEAKLKVLDPQQIKANTKATRRAMADSVALEMLTGLRKREILTLSWEQVFLEEDNPYFQVKKSKQQDWMGVPITEQMLPYFKRRLDNKINQWVFPSPLTKNGEDRPLYNNDPFYEVINQFFPKLNEAKKVGSQQLRTTFATVAYSLGYSYEQIGLFTGHVSAISNTKVATKFYVRREADHHRSGFEEINKAMVGLIEVELVPLPEIVPKELDDAKTWEDRIAILEAGLEDLSEDKKVKEIPELSEKEIRNILIKGAKLASEVDK